MYRLAAFLPCFPALGFDLEVASVEMELGVVVAENASGLESAWSELSLSEAVASDTGTLYVIFQLPANEPGVDIGIGPGFGHVTADSSSCVFLSADGDAWLRLVTDYQLLVDPVYTIRESGMVSLKCGNGPTGRR